MFSSSLPKGEGTLWSLRSLFLRKSQVPLIQKRLTDHSSRTAHYRYYKLNKNKRKRERITCANRWLVSTATAATDLTYCLYQIIIIVVCFADLSRVSGALAIYFGIYYRWPINPLQRSLHDQRGAVISNWNRIGWIV